MAIAGIVFSRHPRSYLQGREGSAQRLWLISALFPISRPSLVKGLPLLFPRGLPGEAPGEECSLFSAGAAPFSRVALPPLPIAAARQSWWDQPGDPILPEVNWTGAAFPFVRLFRDLYAPARPPDLSAGRGAARLPGGRANRLTRFMEPPRPDPPRRLLIPGRGPALPLSFFSV